MIEIVDDTGRILGLFDEAVVIAASPRHQRWFRVLIISDSPEVFDPDLAMDAVVSYTNVEFQWWEVRLRDWAGDPLRPRWYLKAPSDGVAEIAWKSKGFIKLEGAFA